jgi:AcrR family transcriptional regulator
MHGPARTASHRGDGTDLAALRGDRHIVALVDDADAVRASILTLARDGVQRGEHIILIVDDDVRASVVVELRGLGLDIGAAIRSGALTVDTWSATYLRDGRFDRARMLTYTRRILRDGRSRDIPVSRLIADMGWVARRPPGVESLGDYERRLDEALRRRPHAVVCIYDVERQAAATIAMALDRHPLMLTGSGLQATAPREVATARERILAAASVLFHEAGVRGTGVDTLIKSAGVAKATFYRHFPSKDDLVVAWLEDPRSRWFDHVRVRADAMTTVPGELVPVLFDAVAEWLESDGFRGCPYLNTAVEITDPRHPAQPVIRAYLEEIEAYLGVLCERVGLAEPAMLGAELQTLLAGGIQLGVAHRTSAFVLSARGAATRLTNEAARA